MKVLVAIDSSSLSEAVVSEVEERPWPPGAEVCVLTVIDLLAMASTIGYLEPFIKSENDAANKLVESVAERLARRGLHTIALAVQGYPGTTIVEQAENWSADFIFVGSHGHTGFIRFLLGSIAKAVVQNASCSVEIVRHPGHEKSDSEHEKPRQIDDGIRIILATDGSNFSAAAARSIAERPWPAGSTVKVIGVIERPLAAAASWYAAGVVAERLREQIVIRCEEAVAAAEKIIAGAGIKTATEVLDGSPKKRIVDEAKAWDAHLIVVGSHGRRGLTRYLLGSVSEAVAMRAHCSVEVIRDRSLRGVA
ncbi:MAG: universal stress protein [Blastocatellia bacterium]